MQAKSALGLCLAGIVAVAAAFASTGHASGPGGDHLTGSGKVAFVDFPSPGVMTVEQIIVSAHSGPAGEDPHGQITVHSPLLAEKAKADVTCLRVTGSHAVAGGEFSPPIQYLGLTIRHVNLVVQDNGSDDRATGVSFIDRPRPPGFSPCDIAPPPIFEVVQGNYVVKDGAA
jgi:hypothetical protein